MPKSTTTKSKKVASKKVAPKKTVTKKTVAKKAKTTKSTKSTKTTKPKTTKVLVYADNEHSFWVTNGEILNSLIALHEALARMEQEVFVHHVHGEKHDFADWVEYVLEDNTCAGDLRKAYSPDKAHVVVAKHLKSYGL